MIKFRSFLLVGAVLFIPFSGICQDYSDKDLYQEIFSLQEENKFNEADKKIKTIQDPILMGYVLYQQYFAKNHNTTKKEILSWLDNYSDYPVAPDIYALGVQKKIKDLPRPKGLFGGNTNACEQTSRFEPSDILRRVSFTYLKNKSDRKMAQKRMRQFKKYLFRGSTLNAKNLLNEKETKRLWSKKILQNARINLAFSYFLDNRDDLVQKELKTLSLSAVHPFANWLYGVSLWRQNKALESIPYFIDAAFMSKEPSLKTRASFWAARSLMTTGQYDRVGKFLEKASEHPKYFYAYLAQRSMGKLMDHTWEDHDIVDEEISDFSSDALDRFYLLDEIGQKKWASEEISKLYLESEADLQPFIWKIAKENDYGSVIKGLTGRLEGKQDRFPLPDWSPQTGWKVDKALVYSFVRQESCFNARAKSSVGAIGLMQIMPQTAKSLARSISCEYNEKELKNPEYNLALGQSYLKQLLDSSLIQNNLMRLAIAYNAGPGNLNKWLKKMNYNDDPLLFLETIPSRETRAFVERILINYWVYSTLMDQSLEALDQLVFGKWPLYQMCST